jgi:hypothetical protein
MANQVEKIPPNVQWHVNHLPKSQKNYIFINFGMPLKMDDINVLFIFIQIHISCKSKSYMQLQTTL